MSESKERFKDFLKSYVLAQLRERGITLDEDKVRIVNTEIEALTDEELLKIQNGEKVDICVER